MTRTKRAFTFCTLEKSDVLRGLPKTKKIKPSNHHGHLVVFIDCIERNPSISGENPKRRIRSHHHPRAFDARRFVAETRTRRSIHPQRAIRVRETTVPTRTRNQQIEHPRRRPDRPANSHPSFPKAEVKPRPAPNIRPRSSPAGYAAPSSKTRIRLERGQQRLYDQLFRRPRRTPSNQDFVSEVPYPAKTPFDLPKTSPPTEAFAVFSLH